MTSLVMLFIKYVLRIPLRMSEEHLAVGDDAIHGEEAYALFYEGQRDHFAREDYESGIDSRSGVITGVTGKSPHGVHGESDSSTPPATETHKQFEKVE